MFGRKKSEKPAEEPAAPTPAPPVEERDQVLDTFGAVLRVLGDFAFDLDEMSAEEIRHHYEGWARHALVGAPRPGTEAASAPAPASRRDWVGLRQFVCDHRRRESGFVVKSLTDLKQVIWMFIQGLGRAVPADDQADQQVEIQLRRLRAAVDGNDTEAIKREALDSVSLVERVIAERKERQSRHITALASQIEEISGELTDTREKMTLDPLTEIPNRAAFDEQVERMVNLGIVFGRSAFLFLVDIDHFKWVNDKFGHQAGDEVLRQVAGCLKQGFRRKGDFVARYGGDELVAMIQEESAEIANRLGERLLFSIRDLAIPSGEETLRVTASIGAARLVPGETAEPWIQRADKALYAAKELGRDRVVVELPRTGTPPAGSP